MRWLRTVATISNTMRWWWCVSCILVVCNAAAIDNDIIISISELQEQVRGLLDHRAVMDKALDDLKISNQKEVSSLKEEIDNLRREVANVRGGTNSVNQQRNDHLTLQWLQGAVREIRNELQTELTAAHNASELRSQESSSLLSDVALLRSDVSSTRADLETLRGDQTRSSALVDQLEQEVISVKERSQSCAASCANLRTQVETAQSEWSAILRNHKKNSTPMQIFANDALPSKHIEPRTSDLERRVRRVEKKLKTMMWSHATSSTRAAEHAELLERVSSLENASRAAARAMFNVTSEIATLERVQQSTTQLMESVTALETRLDNGIPELQREVSRLEFELAQTTSSVQLAKDSQDQQNSVMKALAENVSRLEGSWDADRAFISALQHERATSTERPVDLDDGDFEENYDTEVQPAKREPDVAVSRLVRDLGRLDNEYRHLVHSLPRDCEEVTKPSGQYAVAPPLAPEERGVSDVADTPLITWCDQKTGAGGWTVVQRRSDGSQQFNRRWAEYEAGFGTPAGEFWLGNSALRRLTADNCSSLRVDLHDIYGQSWFAEYTEFSVGPASDGYRLWVSGYQGNASDAFEYQNMMQFSTVDSDRDISNTHCAANYEGGWWFSHCQHVNLNGRYNLGLTWFDSSRNEWIAVAWSEMKVRRRAGCVAGDKR